MVLKRSVIAVILVAAGITSDVNAGTIKNSKHDLSFILDKMLNSYNDYDQICVYCHTPHNATINVPLWNRSNPSGGFLMYTSSMTMNSKPSSIPSQVSLLCLSCHDGTVAVDAITNKPPAYTTATRHRKMSSDSGDPTSCAACHNGVIESDHRKSYFGKNLTNDHPISMAYPTVAQDPDFAIPSDPKKGWNNVKLYDGKVECASCHNVHDPGIVPFLRTTNKGSILCLKCHTK